MTTSNAFLYGAAQSLGDTAITYALTAARWGVLGAEWYYEAFFSPAAKARYQLIGEIVGHCLILAVITYRMAQGWAEVEVAATLPAPEVVQPAPEVEADPFSPEVNPLPVAIAVVEVADLDKPSIRKLKAMASGKVPNYGRMTKPQLIEALRTA